MVLKQQTEQSAPEPHAAEPLAWQFAALVQHSADLVAITSLQGHIQFLNATGLRLLGVDSLDAARRASPTNYLQPDSAPQLIERILPTVRHCGAWVGELTVRNLRSGEAIPVLANMFLLNDPQNGQPVGYAAVMRDLRERRREEQRHQLLAQVGAELGSTLDYATMLEKLTTTATKGFAHWCAVALTDSEGRVRELALAHADPTRNDQLRAALLAWPLGHVAQWNGMQPDTQTLFLPDLATATFGGYVWEHVRALGGPSLVSTPLKLRDQRMGALLVASPPGRYFTTEDRLLIEEIGSRAAMAFEHAELYQSAQDAISTRDQFISIASHELRTPLTAVLGNLQLFQRRINRGETLPEREQRTLQTVIQQTQRLNRLIAGMLDISRFQQGQFVLDRQVFNLRALVQQVVEELQPTLAHHSLVFAPSNEALVVEADWLRLEQVVLNLLHNAVKYSPSGGTIEVEARQQGEHAIVTVRDQGMGIPHEALPHLFKRFYRAPNAEAQSMSGMGIGLFVAHQITALHGGTITAESASDSGSTFTVTLPVKRKSV